VGSRERIDAATGPRPGLGGGLRAVRNGAGLAPVAVLVMAAVALAAVHFRPSATYTGKDSYCSSNVQGTTCAFKFQASADGRSLRFVGKTVIDAWGCGNGGGEALLGGKMKGATPIPLVKVRASGVLYGSVKYTFQPTQAPVEHFKAWVTGHLGKSGKTATITLHMSSQANSRSCSIQPVTLAAHG
jgi:hypothetical protein